MNELKEVGRLGFCFVDAETIFAESRAQARRELLADGFRLTARDSYAEYFIRKESESAELWNEPSDGNPAESANRS